MQWWSFYEETKEKALMKKFMTYSSQKGTKSNQIENKDKKSKTSKQKTEQQQQQSTGKSSWDIREPSSIENIKAKI